MTDERISQTDLATIKAKAKAEGKAEAEAEAKTLADALEQQQLRDTVAAQGKTIKLLAQQLREMALSVKGVGEGQLSPEAINKIRLQVAGWATSIGGLIQGAIALFSG